jgi:hypothetical protein
MKMASNRLGVPASAATRLRNCQHFCSTLTILEAKAVTDTREPRGFGRSFFAPSQTRPQQTKLAHWPPPFRSGQTQPKIVRHQPDEKPKLAKPRGWRLTRALFSEFDEG